MTLALRVTCSLIGVFFCIEEGAEMPRLFHLGRICWAPFWGGRVVQRCRYAGRRYEGNRRRRSGWITATLPQLVWMSPVRAEGCEETPR